MEGGEAAPVVEQQAVPETYEFAVAEGFDIDAKIQEVAAARFREAEFNQRQMDAAVALHQDLQRLGIQAQAEAMSTLKSGWASAVQKSEWGGDSLKQSDIFIRKADAKFGSAEVVNVLTEFGMINHPAIFGFLAAVGQALGEDTINLDPNREASTANHAETTGREFYADSMGAKP